jgi:hypothetical protein
MCYLPLLVTHARLRRHRQQLNLRRGKDGVVTHPDGRGWIQDRVRASSVGDCSPASTHSLVTALFHCVRPRGAFHIKAPQECMHRHEPQHKHAEALAKATDGASLQITIAMYLRTER